MVQRAQATATPAAPAAPATMAWPVSGPSPTGSVRVTGLRASERLAGDLRTGCGRICWRIFLAAATFSAAALLAAAFLGEKAEKALSAGDGATGLAAPLSASSSCMSMTISGWPLLLMSRASLASMMLHTAAVMHSSASGRKSTCAEATRAVLGACKPGEAHSRGGRTKHLGLLLAKG